jgi:hypothetical protein
VWQGKRRSLGRLVSASATSRSNGRKEKKRRNHLPGEPTSKQTGDWACSCRLAAVLPCCCHVAVLPPMSIIQHIILRRESCKAHDGEPQSAPTAADGPHHTSQRQMSPWDLTPAGERQTNEPCHAQPASVAAAADDSSNQQGQPKPPKKGARSYHNRTSSKWGITAIYVGLRDAIDCTSLNACTILATLRSIAFLAAPAPGAKLRTMQGVPTSSSCHWVRASS